MSAVQLYSCGRDGELQLGAVYTQYAVAELCIANAVPCRAGPVAVPDVSGRSDDQYVKGMNVESNAIQFQNHVICIGMILLDARVALSPCSFLRALMGTQNACHDEAYKCAAEIAGSSSGKPHLPFCRLSEPERPNCSWVWTWVQSGASATRTLCLRTVREIPTYERLAIDELTYPHVGDSNWCEIACEMRRL